MNNKDHFLFFLKSVSTSESILLSYLSPKLTEDTSLFSISTKSILLSKSDEWIEPFVPIFILLAFYVIIFFFLNYPDWILEFTSDSYKNFFFSNVAPFFFIYILISLSYCSNYFYIAEVIDTLSLIYYNLWA